MGQIDSPQTGTPVVHTRSGSVRGVWEEAAHASGERTQVAVFRGIPYAEPPTGRDRYRAPKPRTPWEGVRDASTFGPTPMRAAVDGSLVPEHSIAGADTLSVNVWTSTTNPNARLPVLVWIHGGGYISGSPASPWYEGHSFARDGVILVTLSYRLGFEGFGWVEGADPNRGVLDWICALEWVRDHIAAFGGNPEHVTIAGQSAGGSAVLTLLGTPSAEGLFRGAWAMSPAIADSSVEAAKQRAARLAHLAGVSPDLPGFFSLTEGRVLELQRKITSPAPPHLLHDVHELLRAGLMIGPVIDGRVVTVDIDLAVTEGLNSQVPLVVGTADDELGGLFHPGGLFDHAPIRPVLRALGAQREESENWLRDAMNSSLTSTKMLVGRYATDTIFRSWVPRIAAARGRSASAGPTWSYRFAWHDAHLPAHAGHCADIPFVFDLLSAPGVDRVAGNTPSQDVADAMHGSLVEFVANGSPGWKPDADGTGPTRIFDTIVRDESDSYTSALALKKSHGVERP